MTKHSKILVLIYQKGLNPIIIGMQMPLSKEQESLFTKFQYFFLDKKVPNLPAGRQEVKAAGDLLEILRI